ncbi:23S rRNA (guanosine(2251)-2'-O)-methyltransferase RlmB [Bacteroidota bacterium]
MAGIDYIFGIRTCTEAIISGKEIDKVLIKKGLSGPLFQELFKLINKESIPFQFVPAEKLNRISKKNHQGVITFISPITYYKIEQLIPSIFENGENPLFLILDGITDIRNFGAVARTALCANVHGIIIPDRGSAQINADAIKTSAGALLEIPVCRSANLGNTIKYLQQSGIKIIAATEKANEIYYNVEMCGPTAIIFGSEEKGIFEGNLKLCDKQVRIPVSEKIGSLNISVAAGIMVFEAIRQRTS